MATIPPSPRCSATASASDAAGTGSGKAPGATSALFCVFGRPFSTARHGMPRAASVAPGWRFVLERSAGCRLVLLERIELSTSPLPRECSTTELQQRTGPEAAVVLAPPAGGRNPRAPRRVPGRYSVPSAASRVAPGGISRPRPHAARSGPSPPPWLPSARPRRPLPADARPHLPVGRPGAGSAAARRRRGGGSRPVR